MKAKSILLIVFALGCGSVAAVGATQMLESNKGDDKDVTVPVLVAASDIRAGVPFDEKNVTVQHWPKDRVPEGSLKEVNDLDGKFSNQHLYKGEVILSKKVRNTQDGTAQKIPKGMRVISVKVGVDEAVAGLLKPGDLVDVIVFLRKSKDIPEDTTRTILRKVTVFAVNSKTDRAVSEDGKPITAKTVSLLLTAKQSLGVMLADQKGTLHLSLRRPDDESPDEDEPEFTMAELLGKEPQTPKSANEEDSNATSYKAWLDSKNAVPLVADENEEEKETWSITLMTPEDVQVIRWSDTKRLPDHFGGSTPTQVPDASTGVAITAAGSTSGNEEIDDLAEFAEDAIAH